VWSSARVNISSLNGKLVNINQLQTGVYYLKIIDEQGTFVEATKVIIAK
jgi:hypothetical protein